MAQKIATRDNCISTEGNDREEDVLRQYLELFNHHQFKFYMAPNAVLDWFGKTVRGAENIHMFMRNIICTEYVHFDFKHAAECDPFEYRPTHLQTRDISTRSVQHVNPKNRVPYMTSLKTRANSDEEFGESDNDDVEMSPMLTEAVNKTPERCNTLFEEITPPASTVKNESIAADVTESEDEDIDMKAKRLKRSQPEPFSYLRRLPTKRSTYATSNKTKLLISGGVRTLLDDTSEDEEPEAIERPTEADYTTLHYLETVGIFREKTTALVEEAASNAASTSQDNSTSGWERKIRIRISYRRHLVDQQLQFALIIYEHLDHSVKSQLKRRNLMSELNEVATLADEDEADIRNNTAVVGVRNIGDMADEQPTLIATANEETIGATVAQPNTDEIAAALETAAFSIVPLRTPTKSWHTPPATPKRKSRHSTMSGLKRLNLSPSASTPKRSAARSLRL